MGFKETIEGMSTSDKDGKVKHAITLAKRMLVDSIWKSANVEGLGITFPNTEAILNNIPVNTTRDEVLFCINMRNAWTFLLDNLGYNNSFMLIREFNKIIGANLIYGCGTLRKADVVIGGTSWKPTIPVEDEVYNKIYDLNAISNPIDKALEYFCYLCRAQLFIDGNKRVAQLMANKILIESGIGIMSIPVECREEFFVLLIEFYISDDSSKLVKFLYDRCVMFC